MNSAQNFFTTCENQNLVHKIMSTP